MNLRGALWAVIAAGVAVLIIGVVAVLIQTNNLTAAIRDQQKESVERAKDIQTTQQVIRDCTDPGGACFERGQRQTAKAVGDINQVIVYAAACADRDGVQTQPEIYACVIDMLANDQNADQPGPTTKEN